MPFPTDFLTERLQAERLRPEHVTEIHRMQADPEQMALLGGARTEAETSAYMEKNLRHWEEHGFGTWLLRERASGSVVGRAVLRHLLLEDIDEIEVGYGFHQAWWGRGLAQEITRACLGYARDPIGARSVVALTHPFNARSHRVLERTGFRLEREIEQEGVRHCLFRTHSLWAAD